MAIQSVKVPCMSVSIEHAKQIMKGEPQNEQLETEIVPRKFESRELFDDAVRGKRLFNAKPTRPVLRKLVQ